MVSICRFLGFCLKTRAEDCAIERDGESEAEDQEIGKLQWETSYLLKKEGRDLEKGQGALHIM